MTTETIEEWIAAHGRSVMMIAEAYAAPAQAAEDIFQETMIVAWKKARTEPVPNPGPWLRRIATNIGMRAHRDHVRRADLLDTHTVPQILEPPRTIEEELQSRAAWRHVRALPERQRRILLLSMVSGMTSREIGERLGITEGGVRSGLRDAVKSLRRRLLPPPVPDEQDVAYISTGDAS